MDLLKALDTPFTLKSMKLKNRFVMSPMTRYFSPGGMPTDEVAAYYRRRAEGGVGLIITEGVGTDRPCSRPTPAIPNFCGEALPRWSGILEGVHAAGGAMAPQLWHVGGSPDYNYPNDAPHPLESPSGLIGPGTPGGRVMTEEDVADTVASYARAAADAKRLGFDAVEVHAAHGYLIDQFFWSETNRRDGRFGGVGIAERSRFGAEIVRAMRAEVGEDFVLIFRVSQWKTGFYDVKLAPEPADLEAWLGPLVDAGLDMVDCSQRRFWEPEYPGSDLNLAGWVKKLLSVPTITVGSVGLSRDLFSDFEGGASNVNVQSLEELARRYARGDFDLVALGRVLLADPAWLVKVRDGRMDQLRPYTVEAMQTLF
jgi:2,4-dienoyl-CoA reductase-like NADH-dependent reductase (Old Yellow Enzyme family)